MRAKTKRTPRAFGSGGVLALRGSKALRSASFPEGSASSRTSSESIETSGNRIVSGPRRPRTAEYTAARVERLTRAPWSSSTGRPVGSSTVASAPDRPKRPSAPKRSIVIRP